MGPSHTEGRLKTIAERIKKELTDEPSQTIGRDTLIVGLIFGILWLILLYIRPGYPWSNGKFLVAAMCFAFWGVADMLPRQLRIVATVLRGAVLVFLLCLGTWILVDLVGWISALFR